MRIETIGNATLYLGDCADILPMIGRVDAVITDPPYGIGIAANPIRQKHEKLDWDSSAPKNELIDLIVSLGNEVILWGGNYFNLPPSQCFLIWDKVQPQDFSLAMCEMAWTNIKKKSVKRLVYMQNGCMTKEKDRYHPTQKPLHVMKWCIDQCKNDPQTILDPFMGSGTTGVAAAQMGRKFIGIEREESYFDIACRRIEDAQRMGDMFAPEIIKPVQVGLDL